MSVNSIGPAVITKPEKSKCQKTVVAASIGAAVGTAGGAWWEHASQSLILKNPQESIKDLNATVKCATAYVSKGTPNGSEFLRKAQSSLEKAQDLISSKKIDIKTVGKKALIGAGKVAIAFAAIYFAGKTIIDAIKGNKKAQ